MANFKMIANGALLLMAVATQSMQKSMQDAESTAVMAATQANFMNKVSERLTTIIQEALNGDYEGPLDGYDSDKDPGMPSDTSSKDASNDISETQALTSLMSSNGQAEQSLVQGQMKVLNSLFTMVKTGIQQDESFASVSADQGSYIAQLVSSSPV